MKKWLMFIIIALALIGAASAASSLLSDVPEGKWYSDAVKSLVGKGVISGYPDGTFKPARTATRAEIAVMLDRLSASIESGIDEKKIPLCVENWVRQETQEFVPGEVLIGFPIDKDSFGTHKKDYGLLTNDEILKILHEYGLRVPEEKITAMGGNIAVDGTTVVSVPKGKEFEWICRLSQDNRTIYAEPNFIGYAEGESDEE